MINPSYAEMILPYMIIVSPSYAEMVLPLNGIWSPVRSNLILSVSWTQSFRKLTKPRCNKSNCNSNRKKLRSYHIRHPSYRSCIVNISESVSVNYTLQLRYYNQIKLYLILYDHLTESELLVYAILYIQKFVFVTGLLI